MWKNFIFAVQSVLLWGFTSLGVERPFVYHILLWANSYPSVLFQKAVNLGNHHAARSLCTNHPQLCSYMQAALGDAIDNYVKEFRNVDRNIPRLEQLSTLVQFLINAGAQLDVMYLATTPPTSKLFKILLNMAPDDAQIQLDPDLTAVALSEKLARRPYISQAFLDVTLEYSISDTWNIEKIEVLLKYGADVNTKKDTVSQSAFLTLAIQRTLVPSDDRSIVTLFYKYGANVRDAIELFNKEQVSPLFHQSNTLSEEFYGAALYAQAPMDGNTMVLLSNRIDVPNNTETLKRAQEFAASLAPSERMAKMMPGCMYVKRDAFLRVMDLVKFLGNMSIVCTAFNMEIKSSGCFGLVRVDNDISTIITSHVAQIYNTSVPLFYAEERSKQKSGRALVVAIVDRIFAIDNQATAINHHLSA